MAALALRAAGGRAGARAVADYIAGMTDRYAILEHRALFDPRIAESAAGGANLECRAAA